MAQGSDGSCDHAIAALALGAIKGLIGPAQQRGRTLPVAVEDAAPTRTVMGICAEAYSTEKVVFSTARRSFSPTRQATSGSVSDRTTTNSSPQQRHARSIPADVFDQPFGKLPQDIIAREVAIGVVDVAKIINVHDQQRNWL